MKVTKTIINFLINTNIFVSICVCCLAISSELLLESTNMNVSQFVFFATLFTYNFQLIIKKDISLKNKRTDWTLKNIYIIYCLMVIGISISVYQFLQFNINTQTLIILAGTISILYPYGLRKIPYCKIFIISCIWTISTMLLLISEESIEIDSNISLHLLSRFLFVFAIAIPFDIRDMKSDRIQLKTIPTKIGIAKSKILAIISLSALEIITIYQFTNDKISSTFLIGISISYFVSSGFIYKTNKIKTNLYYAFWVESLSILFYFFLAASILMF